MAQSANSRQVGGNHYRKVEGEQHWDRVYRLGLNYFQAMITRYVERYRDKNWIEDLEKARHFLDKLIELERGRSPEDEDAYTACGLARALKGGNRDAAVDQG